MTTDATRIREAVATRLSGLPGYVGDVRRTPVPQLQSDKLPNLSVYIAGENLAPNGDANAGEPSFTSEITIAISDMRGFKDPLVLDGDVDAAVDAIEAKLLTDPTFVGSDMFEAVTSIKRRRLYPQGGETYFHELRLELTFEGEVHFPPVINDMLDHVHLQSRLSNVAGHEDNPRVDIDLT